MPLATQLDHLQARLTTTLRTLPGATALYVFGSRTRQSDPYADIDLHIVTADLPTSRASWPHFLERVAPIEVAWPITAGPANTAFSILFRGESYYHKVDIGLGDESDPTRFISASPYIPVWLQDPASARIENHQTQAYMPSHGMIGHMLVDELLSSVRYVKARKRNQPLLCWRFLRGKPDRLLQLVYERLHAWQPRDTPLSTLEYKELDLLMDTGEQVEVVAHLNWTDDQQVDKNFYWFTERTTQLLTQKATAQREIVPGDLSEQHLAFISRELNL